MFEKIPESLIVSAARAHVQCHQHQLLRVVALRLAVEAVEQLLDLRPIVESVGAHEADCNRLPCSAA